MIAIDPALVAGGLLAGFVVGLTGMGGGALMTPMLVLLFKVEPLAAVSSDLVVSLFMKPVGGGIHARRGPVVWGAWRPDQPRPARRWGRGLNRPWSSSRVGDGSNRRPGPSAC